MKKIFVSLLAVVIAGLLILAGCTKQAHEETGGIAATPDVIAKDAAFISLNSAMNRFDPQYLRLVYKDQQSVEQLVKQSNDLLVQLNTDPSNPLYQQRLATFYHFKNVDQLHQYSAMIAASIKELDRIYDLKKWLYRGSNANAFYQARRLLAKTKLDKTEPAKKVTGLWSEFVDAYFSEFDYNSYVYNQGLEEAGDGGGGCNGDVCCDQFEICKSEARNSLLKNLVLYAGGGSATLGKLGTAVGSAVPGLGNVVGGLVGAVFGGVTGTIIAYSVYSNDLDICKSKLQMCIDNKPKT